MNMTYSRLQIALHWIVALLVAGQFATGGSIERTHHAVHAGQAPDPVDLFQHAVHNYAGMAIGALMLLRLYLRWRSGVDRIPARTMIERLARAMHLGFYGVLVAQAGLGFIAAYLTFSVAPIHQAGAWLLLAMIAVHVAAALIHAARRDGRLSAMIRQGA